MLPHVSPRVVAAKLTDFTEAVTGYLARHSDSGHLVRLVLSVSAASVSGNPHVKWVSANTSALKVLHSFLVFSVDPRPKVRRSARGGLEALLQPIQASQASDGGRAKEARVVDKVIREFCLGELAHVTPTDCQLALHMCGTLQQCVFGFSSVGTCSEILEKLFALANGQNAVLLIQLYQCVQVCLRSLVARELPPSSAEADMRLDLVANLLASLPQMYTRCFDVRVVKAFLDALSLTLGALLDLDVQRSVQTKISALLVFFLENMASGKAPLVNAALNGMAALLPRCFDPKFFAFQLQQQESKAVAQEYEMPHEQATELILTALSLRYQAMWDTSFRLAKALWPVLDEHSWLVSGRPVLLAIDAMYPRCVVCV